MFILPVSYQQYFILIYKALIKIIILSRKIKLNLIFSWDSLHKGLIGYMYQKLLKTPLLIESHSSFVNNKICINGMPI